MSKRIKDMKTPAARWREKVVRGLTFPFRWMSEDQRFWLGFSVLCLFTALLIQNPLWQAAGEQSYKEGEIAHESIVSPADISFTDTDETLRLKDEAKRSVKPIFRYESNKAEQAVQRFLSAWERLQRRGSDSQNKQSNTDSKIEGSWTGAGGPETGRVFAARTFSRNELEAVQTALKESADGYIFDDSDQQFFQNEVVVFDRTKPNLQSTVSMPESSWTPLSRARKKLRERLESIKSLSPKEIDAFYTATEILIEPSVSYDSVATEAAASECREQCRADNDHPETRAKGRQ